MATCACPLCCPAAAVRHYSCAVHVWGASPAGGRGKKSPSCRQRYLAGSSHRRDGIFSSAAGIVVSGFAAIFAGRRVFLLRGVSSWRIAGGPYSSLMLTRAGRGLLMPPAHNGDLSDCVLLLHSVTSHRQRWQQNWLLIPVCPGVIKIWHWTHSPVHTAF